MEPPNLLVYKGINYRLLGKVRQAITEPHVKRFILSEMVSFLKRDVVRFFIKLIVLL
jgi:hypothetical protein